MKTVLSQEVAQAIADRHYALTLSLEAKRKKGEVNIPNSLMPARGTGWVKWVNGSVKEVEFPVSIMAKWSRLLDKGASVNVEINEQEKCIVFTHDSSSLNLLYREDCADYGKLPVLPVVEVNCDDPLAKVVVGDDVADTKALRKELADARKAEAHAKKVHKALRYLREKIVAVRALRRRQVEAWQALHEPDGKEKCIAELLRQRATKNYASLVRATICGKDKSDLFSPCSKGLTALCALTDTPERWTESIKEYADTPQRFYKKREDMAAMIAKQALVMCAEKADAICKGEYGHRFEIWSVRKNPYKVLVSCSFDKHPYAEARRFMRTYKREKIRSLAELSEAIQGYKMANAVLSVAGERKETNANT